MVKECYNNPFELLTLAAIPTQIISPANIESNYYLNGQQSDDTYALTTTSASSQKITFNLCIFAIATKLYSRQLHQTGINSNW